MYWFCNTGAMEKTNHHVQCGRQQREQTGVLMTAWAALRAAWLQSHSQDEHTKALQILQGAPLWMMGSLGGRQWCCSINWINGQWRLTFWHCRDRSWQLESKRIKFDKFKWNYCSKQQRSLLTHRCQWICWPSILLPDFLSCLVWP